MDSCIKPVSKTFFLNDVFGTDEYLSSYSQKKIKLCYLVRAEVFLLSQNSEKYID